MSVVTRFAPSPTGFLHIGGARTALFNYLFARHHGGSYKLRIEDTDRKRSTPEAIDAIFEGLSWVGLEGDGDPIYQFARASRHAEVAQDLIARGMAYHCYASPEELDIMRAEAKSEGRRRLYNDLWRDRAPSDAPAGIDPVVRLKMPRDGGSTTLTDLVQGDVTVDHEQMDDMILLRADGTPTYMLSVVVDDHDMGVTHVIRGDDHLTNAFRQYHLYRAAGWDAPDFAHIPLIHGPDGAKLSKRHGALGVEAYRDMGYLPEALKNYLLRLGWGHGDTEIVSEEEAISLFELKDVGKAPSRFDFQKLENLNGHYLREADGDRLMTLLAPSLDLTADDPAFSRIRLGLAGLSKRATMLPQLAEAARIYIDRPSFPLTEPKAAKSITPEGVAHARAAGERIAALGDWTEEAIHAALAETVEAAGVGFGKVAQPLRAVLTGTMASPDLSNVIFCLGAEEVAARLAAAPNS